MQEQIDKWLQTLSSKSMDSENNKFLVEPGRRYTKIVYEHYGQKSVHAFVDNVNGNVYKAASWRAPAKIARFNLFRNLEKMLEVCDIYGGYLYLRR